MNVSFSNSVQFWLVTNASLTGFHAPRRVNSASISTNSSCGLRVAIAFRVSSIADSVPKPGTAALKANLVAVDPTKFLVASLPMTCFKTGFLVSESTPRFAAIFRCVSVPACRLTGSIKLAAALSKPLGICRSVPRGSDSKWPAPRGVCFNDSQALLAATRSPLSLTASSIARNSDNRFSKSGMLVTEKTPYDVSILKWNWWSTTETTSLIL